MKDISDLGQKELLDYLKPVIELECSVLEQNIIIDKIKSKFDQQHLSFVEESSLSYPRYQYEGQNVNAGIVVMIVFGILFLLICSAFQSNGLGAFVFLFFVLMCVLMKRSEKKKVLAYDEEIKEIDERNEKIRIRNREKKNKVDAENMKIDEMKNKVVQYMSTPLKETETVLQKLYSVDIIYQKYRTLPALTSIYEYILTGRCDRLTGPHGAYNLYEDELRKDTVISQLNTIIENLEQIKRNQYMLYEKIQSVLHQTQIIASELQSIHINTQTIAELTALNTYYSSVTANNSSALAFYATLSE